MSAHTCPGSLPIVTLNVTEAWERLSTKEQLYAHHFARACWAGMQITASQTSAESPRLLDLIYYLFCDGVDAVRSACPEEDATWDALLDYCCFCVANLGNYKSIGDSKIIPALSQEAFAKVLERRASTEASAAWNDVRGAIYDLDPRYLQFGFPPTHQSQYYFGGVSQEDAELTNRFLAAKGKEAWNTRLERRPDGTLVVRQASSQASVEHAPEEFEGRQFVLASGDHRRYLPNVVKHLQDAVPHCSNETEARMLEHLISHFQTGELELHKEASREWVRDSCPTIETTIGFIESDRDPAGVRAEFEGFVAVVNAEVSRKFGTLVERAQELLERLPWSADFEKDTFIKPEFTSLDVVAFCSGSLPLGICLPNYDDVRQNVGFKNVDLGNVCSARGGTAAYSQYLKPDDTELFVRMYSQADQVLTGLHELIGHGSGKLFRQEEDGGPLNYDADLVKNPCTGELVKTYYKPGESYGSVFAALASAMEECRAECVSLYLGVDADIQEIFGFTGSACEDSVYAGWLGMCWLGMKALEHFDPAQRTWGAVHGRARYAIFRHLLAASAADGRRLLTYALQDGEPKNVVLSMDRELIRDIGRPAIGQLLLEIHVARCTADVSLSRRFEELTEVPDEFLTLREIVVARKRPRDIFLQPTTMLREDGSVALETYSALEPRSGVIQGFVDRFELR